MSGNLLDMCDIVSGFVPINIGSARTGDTISLRNHGAVAVVFFKAAGSASEDPTLTFEQATSITPSSAKALTAVTTIYTKQGTLTSVGTWTKTTQAAAATYSNTTASENEAIWVITIKAEDLDVDNGFDCMRVTVADAGSVNQIACLLYFLLEPRFANEAGISAIIN